MNGSDGDGCHCYGETALMIAADNGRAGVVRALLGHPGMDVNAVDDNGAAALAYAVSNSRRYGCCIQSSDGNVATYVGNKESLQPTCIRVQVPYFC